MTAKAQKLLAARAYAYAREDAIIDILAFHSFASSFSNFQAVHAFKNNLSLSTKRAVAFHKTTRHFSQNEPLFLNLSIENEKHFTTMRTFIHNFEGRKNKE